MNKHLNRVRRLKHALKSKQSTISSKHNHTQGLAHYLGGPALDFVATQIRLSSVKAKQRRWTDKDNTLALSLYHSSPKTCSLLRRVFTLPTKTTLVKALKTVEIYPGFPPKLVEAFRLKVNAMSAERKRKRSGKYHMCIQHTLGFNMNCCFLKLVGYLSNYRFF